MVSYFSPIYPRKAVLDCSRVIETRVEVWENDKCCENVTRAASECFHSFFEFSKLSRVFFRLLHRNTENMFTISFGKHRDEEKENTLSTLIIKCKFSLIAPSVRQQRVLVSVSPSSYRNTIFNQSVCVF